MKAGSTQPEARQAATLLLEFPPASGDDLDNESGLAPDHYAEIVTGTARRPEATPHRHADGSLTRRTFTSGALA